MGAVFFRTKGAMSSVMNPGIKLLFSTEKRVVAY